MSSILTNNSAMSALQSLSATQKSLATTQSQISSGLRIATASDNAAYWSIATKMKSDVSALSSVSDALSLGASALSTGTTAMTAEISTLQAMKASLVSAQQAGTDRVSIQSSITAGQAQLKSTASAASFNGVNYLAGDTGSNGYSSTVNTVSSFSRDATGAVSTSFISVNRDNTLLINTGTAAASGILTSAPAGVTTNSTTAPATTTNYTVDSYVKASGILDSTQLQVTSADYTTYTSTTATASSTNSNNVASTYADGSLKHLQDAVAAINAYNAIAPSGSPAVRGGSTATPVPSLSSGDLKALSFYQAKVTGANTSITGGVTTSTATGQSVLSINISSLTDSDADQTTLKNFVTQVDQAITSLTSAASQIGSAQTRVTAQATFVSSLSDSLTSGVGSLVDADMNVASTRLQALQTQQQLGIQALSIANQNSQLILKLFP